MEEWRAIPGFEGFYEVSDLGRVRSLGRAVYGRTKLGAPLARFQPEKIIAQNRHKAGCGLVHLYRDGKRKAQTVHALVAEAFLGPRPMGQQVAHDDGDADNSCLSNLRYDTPAGNHRDKVRHGTHNRGEKHPRARLTTKDVGVIRRSAAGSDDLAKQYGVSRTCINHVRAGRTWRYV